VIIYHCHANVVKLHLHVPVVLLFADDTTEAIDTSQATDTSLNESAVADASFDLSQTQMDNVESSTDLVSGSSVLVESVEPELPVVKAVEVGSHQFCADSCKFSPKIRHQKKSSNTTITTGFNNLCDNTNNYCFDLGIW